MVGLGHRGAEASLQVGLERGELLPLSLEAPVVGEVQMDLDQADERHTSTIARVTAGPGRTMRPMRILRLAPGDEHVVLAGADLFDSPPTEAWTARFLSSEGHHLFVAVADNHPIGLVSGVETTHPDKGTEMFLYELGVAERYRRRGIARALVAELARLAEAAGCYGMWVLTDDQNHAALATYRAAGGTREPDTVMISWEFPGNADQTEG